MSHWCFLSSKWSRLTWSLRMDWTLYFFGQKSQENSVWPPAEWTLSLCLLRELFQAKVSPHSSQLCFLSDLLWRPMWLLRLLFLLKFFPQTMQEKTGPEAGVAAGWISILSVTSWGKDSSRTSSNVVVSMLFGSSQNCWPGFWTMMIWESLLCSGGLM